MIDSQECGVPSRGRNAAGTRGRGSTLACSSEHSVTCCAARISPSLPFGRFVWIRTLLSAKAELLLQPSSSSQIPPALGGHPGLASFSLCPSNSVPAVTLSDSVLIVTIIFLDHRLHIPFIGNQLTVSMWDMYIFPNMLSISENSYAVAVVPCILSGLLSPHRPIASQDGHAHSSPASLVQPTMLFLLLATQPDHCVAICNPCGSRSSYSSKFSRKTEPDRFY